MRRSDALLLVALALLSPGLRAQPVDDPADELPPGHPGGDSSLPAGHPGADTPPPQDRVSPAPDLRPGTIEVHVRDAKDQPLASVPVTLGILHNDVATGDSKTEQSGTTNAEGIVRFEGLAIGTAYSYRPRVDRGPARFASEPLRLEPTNGQRVLLHVFPTVRDIREALVGMRAVVFVQPRDDVFHVEENVQVLNIGQTAWVPEGVGLPLPAGAKAFRVGDSMSDIRFEKGKDEVAELRGTFGPGQHELGFQFELDNAHDRTRQLRIALPPHVAELRVIAEATRGMTLRVSGFPDAEPMQGQDGSRLLVTGKRLARGDSALTTVDVSLENLPVPSQGRWYAVVLAALFAGGGLLLALRSQGRDSSRPLGAEESAEAEGLLLGELVQLEKLRSADKIGPRTYEETRRALLDALVRLAARAAPRST
ncbi:MAG TPA: hypothetical protein VHE30_10045 [Polyangiaceae bacterium]|nr:hypothetical protein [Polyangiaceae bacterium]